MESPYPPHLPLPSTSQAAPSSTATSSTPNGLTSASGTQILTASEPRRSRKRTVTDGEVEEPLPLATEGFEGEGEVQESAHAARPRGIQTARVPSRRGELARTVEQRGSGRVWMSRSASEGGGEDVQVVSGGPGEDVPRPEKRRRVDTDTDGEGTAALSGLETRRASPHPRPRRLQAVPSYQDVHCIPTRQPLTPQTNTVDLLASTTRPPPTPSCTQPPFSSPLAPPTSASTPPPYSSPPLDSSNHELPPTPTKRARRRANSLPSPSLLRHSSSSTSSFHPSLASREPSPPISPYSLPSSGRCYGSRAQHRHRLQPIDAFSPLTERGRSPASRPRFVDNLPGARAFPSVSQDEVLALHTARLSEFAGAVSYDLRPTALAPPITKATLRELDMQEVMRNPQLRHDVVFDPNLMFRPNYDGERGERKRTAAEQYWTAVDREISIGCRCTTYADNSLLSCVCLPAGSPAQPRPPSFSLAARLPSRITPLIIELRNVLLTLLPAAGPPSPTLPTTPTFGSTYSPPSPYLGGPASPTTNSVARDLIVDVLDPSFVSQQLARGVLDVARLAIFLGATLKTHCAPMRDVLVDEMIRSCQEDGVAAGLRQCFEILELMKLDIANHQLRSLRGYLVQSSVDFERRFLQDFVTRRGGEAALERLRDWLESSTATGAVKEEEPRSGTDEKVVEGLLSLVFASSPSSSAVPLPTLSSLPDTFQLDSYRLQAFHADATDLTVLYVLVAGLYPALASPARPSPADIDSLRKELWCIMLSATGSASTIYGSAAITAGIPQGPPGQGAGKLLSESWRSGMQDVLLQCAARALELRQRTAIATGRTSSSTPSASSSLPPTPDATDLAFAKSYFDTNVNPSSKLFQLLQSRLRSTVQAVVVEELANEQKKGSTSYTSWWAPSVEPTSMTTGGLSPLRGGVSNGSVRPEASMMASSTSTSARRGVKRLAELDGQDDSSEDEGEKRQRTGRSSSISTRTGLFLSPSSSSPASIVDAALSRSGLTPFADEVRLLGQRIAKVAAYNLAAFGPLYTSLLASSSSSSPTPYN